MRPLGRGPESKATTRADMLVVSVFSPAPGKRLSKYQRYSCSARMGLCRSISSQSGWVVNAVRSWANCGRA